MIEETYSSFWKSTYLFRSALLLTESATDGPSTANNGLFLIQQMNNSLAWILLCSNRAVWCLKIAGQSPHLKRRRGSTGWTTWRKELWNKYILEKKFVEQGLTVSAILLSSRIVLLPDERVSRVGLLEWDWWEGRAKTIWNWFSYYFSRTFLLVI